MSFALWWHKYHFIRSIVTESTVSCVAAEVARGRPRVPHDRGPDCQEAKQHRSRESMRQKLQTPKFERFVNRTPYQLHRNRCTLSAVFNKAYPSVSLTVKIWNGISESFSSTCLSGHQSNFDSKPPDAPGDPRVFKINSSSPKSGLILFNINNSQDIHDEVIGFWHE